MSRDKTIIYYTCNRISDFFANNVKSRLLELAGDIPIISVSHKPIDFGNNICLGDIGISVYNIYKQIFIGAQQAKTKYVICCEDDCIYTPEHFDYIPPDDIFYYNENNWVVDPNYGFFWHRGGNMSNCIANTKLLVDTLELRFQKFPDFMPREKCSGFSEPGRHEHYLGLPIVKMQLFKTIIPTLTFNHRPSCGGMRKLMNYQKGTVTEVIEPWGRGKDLWETIHG